LISGHFAGGTKRFANNDWSELPTVMPLIQDTLAGFGDIAWVIDEWLTLVERSLESYDPQHFLSQTEEAISRAQKSWRDTTICAKISSVLQLFIDRKLIRTREDSQRVLAILDYLINQGDRRAAAIQTDQVFRQSFQSAA
jgi:hypothetical protein